MYDALVIGAGPTGCYAARELARLGHEVLVLEEHTEVGEPVHCTGIISLEAYQRFGLDRSCVEAELDSARFVSPSGQSFRVAAEQPRAVVVDRRRFDQSLAEQALSAGCSFLLGTRAERIRISGQRAVVSATCMGERVTASAGLALIATGTDDTLTRQLDVARTSGPHVMGAQLFAETEGLAEVEVHLGRSVAPGGFAWAVPGNGHGCRVGLVTQARPLPLLERFARALEERGAIRRNGGGIRCRAVPIGPRTPSFSDRVLVVGDAAGQVKATTSGGIYYGLLGAEAAASVAHEALRSGKLEADRLASYEEQWLLRIGAEQRTGRVMRRFGNALSDREFEGLFWLARRTGISRLLSGLQFDWHTAGLMNILWGSLFGAGTGGARQLSLR